MRFLMGSISCLLCFCCFSSENALGVQQESQRVGSKPALEKVNKFWTPERAAAFALRNDDPTKWDRKMFQEDMDSLRAYSWPTKPAISNFPSPVGEYDSRGGSLRWPKLTIKNKHVHGSCISWHKGEFNQHLFENEKDNMLVYFNIFILTDDPAPESSSKSIVSRNHPHYLATGKQKTSVGEVDWVQMGLADDNNHAIIAQRIFDLKFGTTILVAPQKDGSLRFMQMDGPRSYQSKDAAETYDRYVEELETNEEVVKFFTGPQTIGLPTQQELQARYQQEGQPVWATGNSLTFFHQDEAEKVTVSFDGNRIELERVPDSDVWTKSKQLSRLNEAVFTYTVSVTDKQGKTEALERRSWRGPDSPNSIQLADSLEGKIIKQKLESQHLTEQKNREITVYLPPGSDNKELPVLYLTDGGATESYAKVVESLILAKKIPPVIMVGVRHGSYIGEPPKDFKDWDFSKDLRAAEYLPAVESEHFPRHEQFFCEEVVAWAESEFNASSDREQRLVFGYSNGGKFAVHMGIYHADIFGKVIACSIGGMEPQPFDTSATENASFYLAAGIWETNFHERTTQFQEAITKAKWPTVFKSRVAGHDTVLWQEELAAGLLHHFGTPTEEN